MNVLSIIRNCLFSLAIVSGFSYCAKPVEGKNEVPAIDFLDNLKDAEEVNEEPMLVRMDSVSEYQGYINAIQFRLNENTKNLDNIKSEFKSDKNKARLDFEGEVFKLNKKNLELKSRVFYAIDSQIRLSDTYFKELEKEMLILESSIIDLRKQIE